MPETARDFITLAMKEAGVLGIGQTLNAEDISDGFTYLMRMLKLWQMKRWMVPGLLTISALGNNAKSNTIGPGGYFNYPVRPDKIQSAYFIQENTGQTPVSMKLDPVFAHEDYDRITLKDLNTLPQIYFYDNLWEDGLGNIYIWPIPSPLYRVYLTIKANLAWPTNVDSEFTLPAEYSEAVHYNLAIRLCSAYKIAAQPDTKMLAKSSLNVIKVSNLQIPRMSMPAALQGTGYGFNLWNPDGY